MKMVSIQIPVKTLARAVLDEIQESRGDKRASAIASEVGLPDVAKAIDDVITATNKLDNAQFSRGEGAASAELYRTAKVLRAAVRFSQTVEKDETQ